MDWQIMFNLLTGLASLILILLGWWAHEIWDQVIKLKENGNLTSFNSSYNLGTSQYNDFIFLSRVVFLLYTYIKNSFYIR